MFSQLQQFQQEFQQLGKDLTAGNLSAAQSDFAALQKDMPQTASSASTTQSSNPIAQAFNQLAQDLQAGNLSAAQQDYANLQQDFESHGPHRHHHHHRGAEGSEESQFSKLFDQLGQDLQSGNLSAAQSDWSSLQQLMQNKSSSTASSGTTYTGVSVTA
jgi:outer membrane protein assembly factor BamD (BamD/ComL family)